jgi:glucan biosynthesis protein C
VEQSGRLHALDNLRALMMWLGIVLHVAVNHFTLVTPGIPWKDRAVSPLADLIFIIIHSFRMPVFFILAGYFVALLVSRHGYDGMLKQRLRRLALPFALFWPVLYVSTIAMVMVYLNVMAHGHLGFDATLAPKEAPGKAVISTLHLWFMYYLLWFCLLTVGMNKVEKHIPALLKSKIAQGWSVLAGRWWGFVVLALPLAAVGSTYSGGLVEPSGSFIPSVRELVHNGAFFAFGWYMYRNQDILLPLYARSWWKYGLAGGVMVFLFLVLFGLLIKGATSISHLTAWIAFVYGCASWLWSFALIGLFCRYLSKQNAVLQYLSESSYWVYLVHMLGTLGFGALIYNLPVGAAGKMGLNIILTTAACLLTYQVLVRYTRIGILLNGRRGGRVPESVGIVPAGGTV